MFLDLRTLGYEGSYDRVAAFGRKWKVGQLERVKSASKSTRWRQADKKLLREEFAPIKIRMKLDERDGFTEKKRAKSYEIFSELAGHPSMKSVLMMRPRKDGDAVIGPFIEITTLEAVISEMGNWHSSWGENERFHPA